MSMTKQQKIGACGGGVFVLCALVLGWFLYSAYSDRTIAEEGDPEEGTEGLLSAKEKYRKFYSQSNPFPSKKAIENVKLNGHNYADWKKAAREEAARGDCPPVPSGLATTVFKQNLYNQVTKMQKLPGGVAGRICAPTFTFGFDKYLGENGVTPEAADIPKLYAQLAAITNVVDLFAQSGVLEVRLLERLENKEDDDAGQSNSRPRKKAKKGKSDKGGEPDGPPPPKRYDYRIDYTVRPSAFVMVLNGLAKSQRFYVVNDFSFEHEGESLKARLDRVYSPDGAGADGSSSRGRRRRGGNDQDNKESEMLGGVVTNPATDKPILVHMKLSVYDFGTGDKTANVSDDDGATSATHKEGK